MKKLSLFLISILLACMMFAPTQGAVGGGISRSTATTLYVLKAGDTMTGTLNGTALTLSGTGSIESLFVTGSATVSGNATAGHFYGDGSTLTGIGGTAGNNSWTGLNTFEAGVWIGTSGTSSIDASGNFYTSGGIRAGDIYGSALIDTGFTTNRFLYSGAGGVVTDSSALTLNGSNVNISTSLEANTLGANGSSYFGNNVNLDDRVTNSPILYFIDAGNQYMALTKYDAGEAGIYNNEGEIQILPSNDTNDYFSFSTTGNNGLLKIVTGDSGDLTIQAEGGNLTLTGAVNIPTTLEANNVGVNTKLYLGNLTATRIPYVDTDKGIIDSGNMVFDRTRLTLLGNIQVGEIHSAWGINTAETSANTIGTAAQTTFYGVGSNLTGIGTLAGTNVWTQNNTFNGGITAEGGIVGSVEGYSIDLVQVGNSGIADNDTDTITFDFVPRKIMLNWVGQCTYSVANPPGFTSGQTLITITGTNSFTSVLNAAHYPYMDNPTTVGDTTNLVIAQYAVAGAANALFTGTGTWNSATKTLTITYQETDTTTAKSIVAIGATAYR